MKKIVLTAVVLVSLLGFTACEQSPTEVTVQAPSQASEFKEVKWIGYPSKTYIGNSMYQKEMRNCLKTFETDSISAFYASSGSCNFYAEYGLDCDYIKIKINEAEDSGNGSDYGDIIVLFKPKNSNAECISSYTYTGHPGSEPTYLQWEYK